MSKFMLATLGVSLVAPMAGLALAQVMAPPPPTKPMIPPVLAAAQPVQPPVIPTVEARLSLPNEGPGPRPLSPPARVTRPRGSTG
jgi:hypothetical protein